MGGDAQATLATWQAWAIAQTAWFVANASLGMAVAFPIVTSLPGIIGAKFAEIYNRDPCRSSILTTRPGDTSRRP